MIRLAFFIHSMAFGGAQRAVANLSNYWAKKGWDITIITLASPDEPSYELNPSIKCINLNLAGKSHNILAGLLKNLHRLISLRKMLYEIKPDIAVGIMDTANILLSLASFGMDIVLIGSERTHPPQNALKPVWQKLRCYTYYLLDSVVVLTQETKFWVKENTKARQVIVIPNPVLFPLPLQSPIVSPKDYFGEGKVVLAVGRLTHQKGFDLLIEAFSLLADKHSDWNLLVIGEGFLRDYLEQQIRALDLSERIFLVGRVGNIGEFYTQANLYVMTSRFEGFPNSLVEALAHGLPAVSFDCDTGPRDIIRQGVDGLLVPEGNVEALVEALDRLMSDSELRQAFAKRAVEARERFGIERIAPMWEQLFTDILKSKNKEILEF